ncbi:YhcH/YjgK/YiaL family protein [Paucilactobacillus suebicus]|uniref:Yhch yjgk yial family protein n=1 Tax=Paucilactobacillus suebicus DSM 5007 = KCTC 3549 TaxID=1423807 RepID=A0A0R1VZ54_9LACO|nr:YhcH/YjgK/YiaL family protein [Paucilactobacillus suebicus]KRM10810.1 hypothetical protein FD16_GL001111 [Paucilactobacillus suebicus DSM 5007 = KCTC 3549]
MLFSNVSGLDQSDYDKLEKAMTFLKETDLTKTPLGRSHEEGDMFYCQTLEYETEDISDVPFEVHQKRLDLHYIVEGEEEIDVSPNVKYINAGEYNQERDLQFVKTPNNFNKIILHQGDFILIGMHEPHRTNGLVDEKSTHVRKIVLKLGK